MKYWNDGLQKKDNFGKNDEFERGDKLDGKKNNFDSSLIKMSKRYTFRQNIEVIFFSSKIFVNSLPEIRSRRQLQTETG